METQDGTCAVTGKRVHYPIFGGPYDMCTMCLPAAGSRGANEHLVFKNDLYVILERPVSKASLSKRTLTAVYQGRV